MRFEREKLLPHKSISSHALKLLQSRPSGVMVGGGTTFSDRKMVEKAEIHGVIFPWMNSYKAWWALTAIAAIFTVFFGPFQIAFQKEPGTFNDLSDLIEIVLTGIFTVDILVNFNLAFYKHEIIVFERKKIASEYLHRMFWIDAVGVFPFETVLLFVTGHLGEHGKTALLFSLSRMLRFVR